MKKITTFLWLLLLATVTEAQQSHNFTFLHDGKTVYGTFTTPKGTGRFPTIIICPGSGAIDRNGTIPLTDGNSACLFPALYGDTLRVYKELSDALVDSGYAVLRYDKLEYTYPTTLGNITFHKLWLPVESAINYVKTRADVDTNRIILIGHSEGSSLIPFIAKGRSDIKALISIAGPRTPFDSLYAWQLNNLIKLLRPCGATATDSINALKQGNQVLSYFNAIRTNTWNGSTPAAFGVPASAWYDYVRATDSVAKNYNLDNLPTLFLGMGLDIQVTPAELIRLQKEVTITNDFWSISGLIHDMTPNNDPHVSANLTDTIIYWLRGHNFATGINSPIVDHNSIQIYPNPANNQINIKTKSPNRLSFNIYNSLGQLMKSGITENILTIVELNNFKDGIYSIEIRSDNSLLRQCFIIQK